jgi:threonyl-tRNA synthetase
MSWWTYSIPELSKAMKVMSVAGAYWRVREKNKQ